MTDPTIIEDERIARRNAAAEGKSAGLTPDVGCDRLPGIDWAGEADACSGQRGRGKVQALGSGAKREPKRTQAM